MLRIALRRVLRRPRLVALLWLVSLTAALCGALPAYLGLRAALDLRPLAQALARGQADAVWVELLADHPPLLPAALGGAVAAGLLSWLVSTLLSGGLVEALRRPGDPRRAVGAAVLLRAAQTAPAMLRLQLLLLVLRLPPLVLLLGGALALGKIFYGRSLPANAAAFGTLLLATLLLWAAGTAIGHYARVYRLARGSAVRALGLALSRARRAKAATLRLAAFSAACQLVLNGAALGVAGRMDRAGRAIALVFLVRQALALLRTGCGLTVLAGAVEVVDTQQSVCKSASQNTDRGTRW